MDNIKENKNAIVLEAKHHGMKEPQSTRLNGWQQLNGINE